MVCKYLVICFWGSDSLPVPGNTKSLMDSFVHENFQQRDEGKFKSMRNRFVLNDDLVSLSCTVPRAYLHGKVPKQPDTLIGQSCQNNSSSNCNTDSSDQRTPGLCSVIAERCHTFPLNAIMAKLTLTECRRSKIFRQRFCRFLAVHGTKTSHPDNLFVCSINPDQHGCFRIQQLFLLQMKFPPTLVLDYKWSYRICHLVCRRLQMDDAMNWLNTLGGGYSALGDSFVEHAKKAGSISRSQLLVALELGEPPLMLRCHLYWALSCMQTGKLRTAKKIIRSVYAESKCLLTVDKCLEAMCKGVWSRLRYMYSKRNSTRNSITESSKS